MTFLPQPLQPGEALQLRLGWNILQPVQNRHGSILFLVKNDFGLRHASCYQICERVSTFAAFKRAYFHSPSFYQHQFSDRDMRERLDALPCACEVEMLRHGSRCDDTADTGGDGGAEAVEGVFKDDGFLGCNAEFFSGMEEEAGIGLHLAGVIDGGDVVEVIVQAKLVHP